VEEVKKKNFKNWGRREEMPEHCNKKNGKSPTTRRAKPTKVCAGAKKG